MKVKVSFLILTYLFSVISLLYSQVTNYTRKPIELFVPRLHDVEIAKKYEGFSFYQQKENWQHIIDSTWGEGLPVEEKLNLFNLFTNALEEKYPCFPNLNYNWDSVRTKYLDEIDSSTSQGRFAAIMSHLAFNMRELHTEAINTTVAYSPLNPGVPLLIVGGYNDVRHFGAVSTVLPDSTLLVIRAVENHPLNLEPGDIILGYEGVLWKDLVEDLMEAELPLAGYSAGCESAFSFAKLICAGMNWHLFETIDIKKYSTGETLHLPTSNMIELVVEEEFLINNEQISIPEIPFPKYIPPYQGNYRTSPTVSYGLLPNSDIGLIYLFAEDEERTSNQFLKAIEAFEDTTDGLIIDMRYNRGGWSFFEEAFEILFNSNKATIESAGRCSPTSWELCSDQNSSTFQIIGKRAETYDKPIAVLLGPNCASMGDITAYRLSYHPNVRFFGKSTSASMGLNEFLMENNWIIRSTVGDMFKVSEPNMYLNQREFPIDYPVWLSPADVAIGYDTVLEEAKKYLDNLTYLYSASIDKQYSTDIVNFSAKIYNPKSHDLFVHAKVMNNDTIIDSIFCEIQQGRIIDSTSNSVRLTNYPQDFYSISIISEDLTDTTMHTLENYLSFTTVPCPKVEIVNIEEYTLRDYRMRLRITNMGKHCIVQNPWVQIFSSDSSITYFTPTNIPFPTLEPDSVAVSTSYFYVDVDDSFDGYFDFKYQVLSDEISYWELDSINVAVGVEDDRAGIPIHFSLKQNYPNPFNPSTKISYSIPKQNYVSLKVFDVLGREVKNLVNKEQSVGNYEVEFDASNLTSGIYFYRIHAGDFVESKKMVLMK